MRTAASSRSSSRASARFRAPDRSRSEAPLGTVGLSVRENLMLLAVPNAYLRAHPLTRAELQAEADQLPALGLTLTVAEV